MKILLFLVLALPILTFAHPGRTNSEGCHSGKEPYHCHGSKKTDLKNN